MFKLNEQLKLSCRIRVIKKVFVDVEDKCVNKLSWYEKEENKLRGSFD